MFKSVITLLAIAFTLVFGFLGAWYLANPEQWNRLSIGGFGQQPSTLSPGSVPIPVISAFNNTPGQTLPIPAMQTPAVTAGNPQSERFNEVHLPQTCTLPASTAVTRREGSRIYSWRNQDGRLTFSDRPPADNSVDTRVFTGEGRLDYFSLKLDLRGSSPDSNIRNRIDAQATAIYRIFSGLVGDENLRKVDLNIIVLPDRNAYRGYATSVTGRDMSRTGGFYSTRTHEAVTFIQQSPERTLEVIRHEATHVITTGILGLTPLWLNEGLAEYFSKLSISGQRVSTDVHERALQLARTTIQSAYPRTLRDFLELTDETWRNARMDSHYALAWSLVFFLMSTDEGRTAISGLMHNIAANYCRRTDATAVLQESYPGGIRALQTNFISWLTNTSPKRPHVH